MNRVAIVAHADSYLVESFPFEFQLDSNVFEGIVGKLADRVLHTRCNHEILWFVVLQDEPHALHVIFRISPVT